MNLRDLVILVADPSSYISMLIHGMLRGFGSNKILEVRNSNGVLQTLMGQKIDIMICDMHLPPHGGLSLTRAIRGKTDNEHRTMPILCMSSDSREATIKRARDAGANMVITKPLSPKSLYSRLVWVTFDPRGYVETPTYYGPDRRFKIEGFPDGQGRRKGDLPVEVAESDGSDLSQNEIDSLFAGARNV